MAFAQIRKPVAAKTSRPLPRARMVPKPVGVLPDLQLKSGCSCGGFCPSCQAKEEGLTLGQPGDRFEQQADKVADKVMRMQEDGAMDFGTEEAAPEMQAMSDHEEEAPELQSMSEHEEESPDLQMKEASPAAPARSTQPRPSRLDLGGGGRPLPGSERRFFERRLGTPLGHVRIHDGPAAAAQAQRFQARAFTHRSHIAFAPGEYRPGTSDGRRLLAHELVHVMQQQGSESPSVQRLTNCRNLTYKTCKGQRCGDAVGGWGVCGWGGIANGCRCMGRRTSYYRILRVLAVLGLSLALVGTVAYALLSPEPASKLLAGGMIPAEVVALLLALGYTRPQIREMGLDPNQA